jgi:hypothetical protein
LRDLDKQREWRERNKERTVAARRALRERAREAKIVVEQIVVEQVVVEQVVDDDLVRQFIAKHGVKRYPSAALVPTTADIKPTGIIAAYHDARNADGDHLLRNVMNRRVKNATGR